jgi:hypothetical protein
MTDEELLLEQRKVKALEKIATTLDALTVWFEEIEKDEWSDRIQWYMAEWHKTIQKPVEETKQPEVIEEPLELEEPLLEKDYNE